MEEFFKITSKIKILNHTGLIGVDRAIKRFQKDISMSLKEKKEENGAINLIKEKVSNECFHIYFENGEMCLAANDELGFIYGLFYISESYLGVQPFWFWNDQSFNKMECAYIPIKEYWSKAYKVKYRGWFVNDEVLISHWKIKGDCSKPWEMIFEALLRLGGNMVIPGTDKNSKKYKKLALDMGLWVTQHHAEPLGAEMFSRAYPQYVPSYAKFPELFQGLWKRAIEEQKNEKIIWNLGFRGQGDIPFWNTDPLYDTPEKRGELISSLIEMQYNMVLEKVSNPICCTNLYGEVMELYHQGLLKLPENIIKIWADNGYGKMVSRRQENHNPRIYALPYKIEDGGHHGIYYHASFFDLQAANHITMSPNSIEFVNREFDEIIQKGANDFWIINCSNVKPHVFLLDFISRRWRNETIDVKKWSQNYIKSYYIHSVIVAKNKIVEEIYACIQAYFEAVISFGVNEDEHAGEQFYNYTVRILASQWQKGKFEESVKELVWAFKDMSFKKQMKRFYDICLEGLQRFEKLYLKCIQVMKNLEEDKQYFEDSIFLNVQIHLYCLKGVVNFCESYHRFCKEEYWQSFYLIGKSKEYFEQANQSMREKEHGLWEGFYENECLTDIKQTAYVLRGIMSYIRNIGEGPHFYYWQRQFLYSEEDRKVVLITNMENHMTDEALYDCINRKVNDGLLI